MYEFRWNWLETKLPAATTTIKCESWNMHVSTANSMLLFGWTVNVHRFVLKFWTWFFDGNERPPNHMELIRNWKSRCMWWENTWDSSCSFCFLLFRINFDGNDEFEFFWSYSIRNGFCCGNDEISSNSTQRFLQLKNDCSSEIRSIEHHQIRILIVALNIKYKKMKI